MGLLMWRPRPVMRNKDSVSTLAQAAYAATKGPARPSPTSGDDTAPNPERIPGRHQPGALSDSDLAPAKTKRAAALVRAVKASITGDSSVVGDLYTDDVKGWTPALNVSSAAELAVEVEDQEDAFSDIELAVSPLDVGDGRACVEWVATLTHSGPLVLDGDVRVAPTSARVSIHGVTVAEFDGDRICSFRQYWDELELLEQLELLASE